MVFVLDRSGFDPWPGSDMVVKTPERILQLARDNGRCFLVIEEVHKAISKSAPPEIQEIATTVRHFGCEVAFIAQRLNQVNVTMRDQCNHLWLFAVSKKDSKILADEFNEEGLEDAYLLPNGTCFYINKKERKLHRLVVFEPE